MNDTVRKLMELADDYAMSSIQYGVFSNERGDAKDALKAELVRLFTPLSDEQIATVYFGATGQSLRPQDNVLAHKFAQAIEKQHGIGGES